MNNMQLTFFHRHFASPIMEPIFTTKSVVFFGVIILTFGLYSSAKTLSKRRFIRELNLLKQDLQIRVTNLTKQWDDLEADLVTVSKQLRSFPDKDQEDIKRFQHKLDELSSQRDQLEKVSIRMNPDRMNPEFAMSLSDIALGKISFVGQLIANVLSLGLYGVYQNYALKNRITILKVENANIQDEFEIEKQNKFRTLNEMIEAARDLISTKKENDSIKGVLDGIKNTDKGQAYLAEQQAKRDSAVLQQDNKALQAEITALKADKLTVERDKKLAEDEVLKKERANLNLRVLVASMGDDEWKLKQERDRLQQEVARKEANLKEAEQKKKGEIDSLQVQLHAANAKAARVFVLEREVASLQNAQKHQPEMIKLAPEVGLIPPKYIPRPEDNVVLGAMDIINKLRLTLEEEGCDLDEASVAIEEEEANLAKVRAMLKREDLAFFESYNRRYQDKQTAGEIIVNSFEHAYSELISMGKNSDNIQLNESSSTAETRGAYAVYRFMALDLIRGGKVDENGCHGFQLCINRHISMLPSQPEKILQYKDDSNGGFEPAVTLHYRQRDDFTPDEGVLRLRDGVHAVAAKWIWEQLSEEERRYLFIHLMEPVIENEHPDYQLMIDFMQQNNPRAKLVQTASELIQDIGTAIENKFGQTVLKQCWRKNAVKDIEPFVKAEDDPSEISSIPDFAPVPKGPKVVDWELDPDVIGDKRLYQRNPSQADFLALMTEAQANYQAVFRGFQKEDLLQNPRKPNQRFETLEWEELNKHFHPSHQMIGANPNREYRGGERCLLSNLLAILVTDKKHLTTDNVHKLRKAMANYLDKLQQANGKWATEKLKDSHLQSTDAPKLKEMAQLAETFQKTIQKEHGCTMEAYQAWLRKDTFGAAKINVNALSPFEIQLVAYTIGVRIGIVSINTKKGICKVDQYGRIVPEGEIYGPNTPELLLMGFDFSSDRQGGSYYGLFPKLRTDKKLTDPVLSKAVSTIESYWKNIDLNYHLQN